MRNAALRTWLIVLITAVLGLAVGAAGVAVIAYGVVIPGIKAGFKKQMQQAKQQSSGPPPAAVRVAPVEQRSLRERFEVVGRLQELERTTVAAEVSGRLLAVPIEPGDRVVADETVLARVDDVWARLDRAEARADVAAAEATLDQSRRDLRYLEDLREADSARPKEVQDARATVKSNEARLESAVARRERAQERVQRLIVHAPFDGVVTEKLAEVGEWVGQGDPVAEVISRGRVDALVNVPENQIGSVEQGDQVRVRIDPLGTTATGRIVAIHPSGDNPARTFPVEVRLDDRIEIRSNDGETRTVRLRPGMSVTGFMPVSTEADRLVVPSRAVSFGPRGAAVWLANPPSGDASATQPSGAMQKTPKAGSGRANAPGKSASSQQAPPTAVRVDVEVLFAVDDGYAVQPVADSSAPSIAVNDQVVIEGWERLTPGQPLEVVGVGMPEVARPDQRESQPDQRQADDDQPAPAKRADRNGEPTG